MRNLPILKVPKDTILTMQAEFQVGATSYTVIGYSQGFKLAISATHKIFLVGYEE